MGLFMLHNIVAGSNACTRTLNLLTQAYI